MVDDGIIASVLRGGQLFGHVKLDLVASQAVVLAKA